MNFRSLPRLLILLPLVLAACGDLPEPFLGNPGQKGRQLATPGTPMLAVPPPSGALLDAQTTGDFADLLAVSLQSEEIPTLAREPRKTDWRLVVTARRNGEQVVPRYAVEDPTGREQGAVDVGTYPASGWTSGATRTLGQAAHDAVPKIVALMMSIRATRDRADPNSLMHRVAKLYVPEVTGAPGDGNSALTKQIRTRLAEFGPLVQLKPDSADFVVKGEVVVTRLPKGQQQVEIAWTVTRPSGVVTGKVSQLNSVAAGSLDGNWGDVAVVVAQEAASGIDRVVERFINRDGNAAGEAKPGPGDSPGKATGPGEGVASGKLVGPAEATAPGKATEPGKATGSGTTGGPVKATAQIPATRPGDETASDKRTAGEAMTAGKSNQPASPTSVSAPTIPWDAPVTRRRVVHRKRPASGEATAPVEPAKPAGE